MKTPKKKTEFSKSLLIWETILIWVVTLAFIALAYVCIIYQYLGELPWLAAMCGFPWTAYGVSQACYYRKAEKENTKGGIKYHATMHSLENGCQDFEEESEEN